MSFLESEKSASLLTDRTELLLGREGILRLKQAHVLVVGVGGVGAFAVEALARAGVGEITLVDADIIEETNLNRQLVALHSTLGRSKVAVMAERLRDINPEIVVHELNVYLGEENVQSVLHVPYDYIVDAIDSLSSKALLIQQAKENHIPIIVSLGSAGKRDCLKIQRATLNQTHGCPLAKALRRKLVMMNCDLKGVEVIFSPEPCMGDMQLFQGEEAKFSKRSARGTISYLPAMFGLHMASVVIERILESISVKK